MNETLKEKVEKIMEEGNVGYAYLYPSNNAERQEFVFSMTPKNIANFLGSHFLDASKMILTDQLDRLILDSHGGFINCCPDQNLCKDILKYLVPIQMEHQDAEEFLMVTRDEYNEYGRWEDEQVTIAEMSMG